MNVFLPPEPCVQRALRGAQCAPERLTRAGRAAYTRAEKFLRVSNSVIVARAAIVRISPALSMKFTLTLSDKRRVDVTRSYYYTFKEYMGI